MIQGSSDEAEPLFREALRIDTKVYGEEHHQVATDLNNLAQLLQDQVAYYRSTCPDLTITMEPGEPRRC